MDAVIAFKGVMHMYIRCTVNKVTSGITLLKITETPLCKTAALSSDRSAVRSPQCEQRKTFIALLLFLLLFYSSF